MKEKSQKKKTNKKWTLRYFSSCTRGRRRQLVKCTANDKWESLNASTKWTRVEFSGEVVAVWKLKATEWTSYADGGVRHLKVQQILFYRVLSVSQAHTPTNYTMELKHQTSSISQFVRTLCLKTVVPVSYWLAFLCGRDC